MKAAENQMESRMAKVLRMEAWKGLYYKIIQRRIVVEVSGCLQLHQLQECNAGRCRVISTHLLARVQSKIQFMVTFSDPKTTCRQGPEVSTRPAW